MSGIQNRLALRIPVEGLALKGRWYLWLENVFGCRKYTTGQGKSKKFMLNDFNLLSELI